MTDHLPLDNHVRVVRDTVSLTGRHIPAGTLGLLEAWGPRGYHGVRIETGDYYCLPTQDLELT